MSVPMERLRRVAGLWNWLPAFRVVAETGSLRAAAELLHVSPSALSRSVRLLEEAVGQPLFDRVGRNLRLNAAGEHMLLAVRRATRTVHDGLAMLDGEQLVGPLVISTVEPITSVFLAPALRRLATEHPHLVPRLDRIPTPQVAAALRQGELDVAFTVAPVAGRGLTLQKLGEASSGLYCAPGHPLAGRAGPVAASEVADLPFCVPAAGPRATSFDPWPPYLPRRVAMTAAALSTLVEACASGRYLAVLPDVLAAARGDLRRLRGWDLLPPYLLYAARRDRLSLDQRGRVDVVVELTAAEVARCPGQPRGRSAPGVPSSPP